MKITWTYTFEKELEIPLSTGQASYYWRLLDSEKPFESVQWSAFHILTCFYTLRLFDINF